MALLFKSFANWWLDSRLQAQMYDYINTNEFANPTCQKKLCASMHADHVSQWSQTALGYFQVTNNLVCIRKNAIHHCLSFSGESAQTGSQIWKKSHYSTTVAKSTWQTCFHRYWSTSQISVIKWSLTLLHWYEVHNNLWVQNIITVQLSQGFYFNIFRNMYYNATVVVSDDSARNCDILPLVHSIQDMRSLHLHYLIMIQSRSSQANEY